MTIIIEGHKYTNPRWEGTEWAEVLRISNGYVAYIYDNGDLATTALRYTEANWQPYVEPPPEMVTRTVWRWQKPEVGQLFVADGKKPGGGMVSRCAVRNYPTSWCQIGVEVESETP